MCQGKFTTIDATNGINEYEVILMAEDEIKKCDFPSYFGDITPKIRNDEYAKIYPDFWFVDYTPEVYMDFTSYLLVVNKKTGEIIRARDYYWPEKQPDLAWVFN